MSLSYCYQSDGTKSGGAKRFLNRVHSFICSNCFILLRVLADLEPNLETLCHEAGRDSSQIFIHNQGRFIVANQSTGMVMEGERKPEKTSTDTYTNCESLSIPNGSGTLLGCPLVSSCWSYFSRVPLDGEGLGPLKEIISHELSWEYPTLRKSGLTFTACCKQELH